MNIEKKISFCKLSALCSIIAGLSYLLIALLSIKLPQSIINEIINEQYFQDFQIVKLQFYNVNILTIIAKASMIGVVCGFLSLCRDKNFGIVTYVSILAVLGFGFGIYQNINNLTIIPKIANEYLNNSSVIRDVIVTIGFTNPKMFLLTAGFPGIWFIVVSILGWSNKEVPKFLLILGILWGINNILIAFSKAFGISFIMHIVSLQIIVIAPIWGLYEGYYLLSITKKLKRQIYLKNPNAIR